MTPRFFTCSVPECERPHVRDSGGCNSCNRYLCITHISPSYHTCKPSALLDDEAWESQLAAEVSRLRARINDAAVCAFASRLNGGRACTIEYPPEGIMGCANYHGRIRFSHYDSDDDQGNDEKQTQSRCWLLRVPRVEGYETGMPESLARYLVLSEYSTLKFLETTAVPAPRVFGYGLHGNSEDDNSSSKGKDHGVGVSFLLMEELPGKPWIGEGVVAGEEATPEEKAKVWAGVADILAELARHPFPRAGSLCLRTPDDDGGEDSNDNNEKKREEENSSDIEVSAQASDRFVVLTPDDLGPFDNSLAYYTAFAEQYLALIADGQIYTSYPIDAYLAYLFLKDRAAPQLAEPMTPSLSSSPSPSPSHLPSPAAAVAEEKFFLKHVDDKGDHLLVDDELNVTGIIDWQMSRVVPFREAFGPSLVTADMSALCGGTVSLSDNDIALADILTEKGLPDLAACMADRNERTRRFFWGLGLERKWSNALPLANALLKAFGVEQQEWTQWKEIALRKYCEVDDRLSRLMLSSRQT